MFKRFLALTLACLFFSPPWAEAAAEQILINKGTNQLAFYQDNQLVKVFPIATGKTSELTPEGNFRITSKIVNPPYYKKKIPGGSPDNPLGPRWLGLSAPGGAYGIHGNNNYHSIGTYASEGCIRLYNEDILWLYEQVPVGTPVKIIRDNTDLTKLTIPEEVILTVNGNYIPPNCRAIILEDDVMVALRPIAEFFGYQVNWDNEANQVIVTKLATSVMLQVGRSEISINDTVKTLSHAPIILEHHTYVPLDFFTILPDIETTWHAESKQVNFNDHTTYLPRLN